jgi:hypothetical protein
MDRTIIYPGELGRDVDFLQAQQSTMAALGWLAQAVLGTAPVISGLGVNPAGGLVVSVAPGLLAVQTQTEYSQYGSLPPNSALIMKMGVNAIAELLTLAAPTTAGQSVCIVIQCQFVESDTAPLVLPFFNDGNPDVQYNGPGNSGDALNTVRAQSVAFSTVVGTPAATGSQTIPSPTTTPIAVVTIPYGTTNITSGMIAPHPAAPVIRQTLPAVSPLSTRQWIGASGSFTPPVIPANVMKVRFRLIGAGASGASCDGTNPGGGGGAGAILDLTVSSSAGWAISGNLGAPGAAPSSGAHNGNDGADSTLTVNGITFTVAGGKAGVYGSTPAGGIGGAVTASPGGAAILDYLSTAGGAGEDGNVNGDSAGGAGGGAGGRGAQGGGTPANALGWGGGGGGAYATAGAGGAGFYALLSIEY